jgi:flagellin
MVISSLNTNIAAITAAGNLDTSTSELNNALAQLSSGSKIVTPADDPAGLAESIALTAQIGQTNAANDNVSNALSFSQTQDGYLQQVGAALDQMSTLAVEAQDPTKSASQLADYNTEYKALAAYITSTGNATYNGVSLFSGTDASTAGGLKITTDGTGDTFTMTAVNLNATAAYTAATGANISTSTGAVAALTAVTTAITALATDRANVGGNEERLNFSSDELGVLSDNLTAANSNLTDVDVATESTKYAQYQILVQSGTAMLAQANQNPANILKLLS